MAMLNDPDALRGLLLGYADRVLALEPKASALDRIATAEGSLCTTAAAKALQMRPTELFRWLSTAGWVYRRAGSAGWLGYQDKVQRGFLEHKVTTVQRADGGEKIVEQVRITPRGLAKLAEMLAGERQAVAVA
jgi:phage antirepressor YoqD-like protein